MDKSIEYILEVARCGGITKAANNLFITPSALSKFVQAKEDELQVKLFHRQGKKFVLTQAGEYYVEKSREIEVIQQDLSNQMKRFSSMSHGEMRIGVQASFAEVMVQKIIPLFQNHFPGVKIFLMEHTVGTLVQMLKNSQLDIVVSIADKQETGVESVKLCDCQLVMAVPAGSSILSYGAAVEGFWYPWIDLKYCEQEPNVMLRPGSPFRTYADNLYGYYGLTPNMMYQFVSTRTGLMCVAHSSAVMITLDQMVLSSSLRDRISLLCVGEKPMLKELAAMHMDNLVIKEEIYQFIEIARSCIAEK